MIVIAEAYIYFRGTKMKFLAFKLIVMACLAFYGVDYAAVPNPPQIECTTDCVDPPSGGTGTYDLGTLPAFVQDIEWPQDPQITFERTISSNSDFQAALSTNGQRSLVYTQGNSARSPRSAC